MSQSFLFIDTSALIQIGVLNEDLEWEYYEVIHNRKGSQILHTSIYEALKGQGLKLKDINGVFLANGPGSYTGIRVGEGFAQVLELEGIPVYSFYHFEVPAFLGIKKYRFFSEAFKKEIFSYEYTEGEERFSLMSEKDFNFLDLSEDNLFSLEGPLLDRHLDSLYQLFKKSPGAVFQKVRERGTHHLPYYYRSLEKEFKVQR